VRPPPHLCGERAAKKGQGLVGAMVNFD